MQNNKIIKYATLQALGTAAYVTVVGLFMSNASRVFGEQDKFFTPVVVLMLLVLSATICGALIFGRSVLWFLDGKKKEAVVLFGYTLAAFFVLTIVAFFILYVSKV